jgi:hypothetical protein
MQDPGREVETQAFHEALLHELDNRITEFSAYDWNTFGRVRPVEAAIAAAVCIGVPIVLLWFAA